MVSMLVADNLVYGEKLLVTGRCNGLQHGWRCHGFASPEEAEAALVAQCLAVPGSLRPVYYGDEWQDFLEII